MRVWGMIKVADRIKRDVIINADDFMSALILVCEHFDLAKPIMVQKHYREVEQFNRTIFYSDDFVESVPFDTLEVEIIITKKKRES
jgi:hypothetical protein